MLNASRNRPGNLTEMADTSSDGLYRVLAYQRQSRCRQCLGG